MKFSQYLHVQKIVEDQNDLSGLPPVIFDKIKSSITKQIKAEPTRIWSNALEPVHGAYEQCSVQRPTPAMRIAWLQYEDLITHSVRQLAKFCENDKWKSTSISSTMD